LFPDFCTNFTRVTGEKSQKSLRSEINTRELDDKTKKQLLTQEKGGKQTNKLENLIESFTSVRNDFREKRALHQITKCKVHNSQLSKL